MQKLLGKKRAIPAIVFVVFCFFSGLSLVAANQDCSWLLTSPNVYDPSSGISFEAWRKAHMRSFVERWSLLDSDVTEVVEVKSRLSNAKEILRGMLSSSSIAEQEDFDLFVETLRRRITWPDHKGGVGYLSSSLRPDAELERLWTSVVAGLFSEAGYHPLVVPIDAFYSLYPEGSLGFVDKTTHLNSVLPHDAKGRRYALILTGVSESGIFTGPTLELIPSQDSFLKSGSVAEKVSGFNLPLASLFTRVSSARMMPEYIQAALGEGSRFDLRQIRLLLVTTLLLQDKNGWQDLWYEHDDGGVPLYVVAPWSFHAAMDRLNENWGHRSFDYTYRAQNSLGAQGVPAFDRIKGRLVSSRMLRDSRTLDHSSKGLKAEGFSTELLPLLPRLDRLEERK